MGILRTDIISHSQLESAGGSVDFDGSGDYLTIPNHSAFHFTGDYTIDFYIKFDTLGSVQRIFGQRDSGGGDIGVLLEWDNSLGKLMYYYSTNGSTTYYFSLGGTSDFSTDTWYHIAIVGINGLGQGYRDGVFTEVGNGSVVGINDGDSTFSIGRQGAYTANEFNGSIYGFRITTGALYKGNFTVPKFKPKVLPGTLLLCCQSSTSVTEAEVSVAGDITSNGDPQVSADTPLLKEDITDTGVVFDGVTTFDSQAYMVPPSGKTTERNRGRGLIGQGKNTTSPNNMKAISFIEIQSGGTAFDFGDSTNGSMYAMTAVSSSTRAVFAGGHTSQASPYPVTNLLEFVTIANTSNCTDFGDLAVAAANKTGASNQTRGLIAGGYSPSTRQIDKIEIATLGNATDYGDLTDQGFYGLNQGGMVSSSTRGVYAGGSGNSSPVAVNTITFSLFSTSGNSTDFGDLTHTNGYFNVGNSNGVRGVFMGGADIDSPYAVTDQIDFITIATAGNATDFGSLSTGRYAAMGASNSTRGVIAGGRISPTPSLPATNLMEFINIASTGNGLAFGELIEPERSGAGCSDSHGGLS